MPLEVRFLKFPSVSLCVFWVGYNYKPWLINLAWELSQNLGDGEMKLELNRANHQMCQCRGVVTVSRVAAETGSWLSTNVLTPLSSWQWYHQDIHHLIWFSWLTESLGVRYNRSPHLWPEPTNYFTYTLFTPDIHSRVWDHECWMHAAAKSNLMNKNNIYSTP